jgi:hypothetical protein
MTNSVFSLNLVKKRYKPSRDKDLNQSKTSEEQTVGHRGPELTGNGYSRQSLSIYQLPGTALRVLLAWF